MAKQPTSKASTKSVKKIANPAFKSYKTHASDPTLSPFLKGGRKFIGERGMSKIIAGKEDPKSDDIREKAISYSQYRTGQGLHEWVPTNMGKYLRAIKNKSVRGSMAQAMSGLRSTPALSAFRIREAGKKKWRLGGHTGTYINPKTNGSTHTNIQSAAHDELRETLRQAVSDGKTGDSAVLALAHGQLDVSARGENIMQAQELTGAIPNRKSLGALEPITAKSKPNRIAHAQEMHFATEEVKARARGIARDIPNRDPKRDRSPSPERHPIDNSGNGGHYISKDTKTSRVEKPPTFPNDGNRTLALAAWVSHSTRSSNK